MRSVGGGEKQRNEGVGMVSKSGYILIGCALLLLGGSFFLRESLLKSSIPLDGDETVVASEIQKEFFPVGEQESSPVVLFGGDMMFDRYIRTVMRQHGNDFPLAPLRETFVQADLVVANLEGPITDNNSRSETSLVGARDNYFFTFDPVIATVLRDFHIGVVNIGNNHILNFKEAGAEQTKQFLKEAGVRYFGSPLSGDERILMQDARGVKIALVNYNQFVWQGRERAFEDIKTAKEQADVVILYTHWGTEYVTALPKTKELAHEFIDVGVDLIIGSHPHVVQEKEVYQGKTIYYSLGNLVFDQYFSLETTQGLLIKATFDRATQSFTFEEIPLVLKNTGQTALQNQ